ncbi:MAG: recombinase family protein [Oligoflexia bacterium]|nr:recombinase family protein [Oligoflexia bacterium]
MAKNQNYKIALYIRVSTEEQAENPEGSIRNQEDRLRQAVVYKSHSGNFGEIKAVFVDAGISAKNMKRPKLQELLRAIRSGEIDLVMVTELSRLSRNTRDFIEMWDMMKLHGCGFTSLREDFDTTTAAGEMVILQLMNLAQFERRQTSERVEANIAARAARGLYNGGCVPLGYKTIPERPGYLQIDEEMAEIVRAAFTAFLGEGSLSRAALWLNDNGYRLKKQREGGGRMKRVGHFTVDNLQALLRNKVYIGVKVYTYRGEVRESKAVWPSIIDEATFHRIGTILDKNKSRFKPTKQNRRPYLLSGITHCQTCQSFMPGKSATGNSGKVAYYEHAWATKRDSTLSKKLFKCEPHRVPAKKLEPLVMEKFKDLILRPDFMKDILKRVREKHEENPHRKDEERLKAKISGITSQIDGLAERLSELPKMVSAAPIYKQMERLQEIKESHEKELQSLKTTGRTSLDRVVDLNKFEDFVCHFRKFVNEEIPPNDLRQLIKKFIHKVEVGTETVKIHWIVDEEHYERELALKRAGSSPKGVGLFLFENRTRNFGSQSLTFGARHPKIGELLTQNQRYQVQWRRPKMNLAELVKLKSEGWSHKALAERFMRKEESIEWWFRAFRRNPKNYKRMLKGFPVRKEDF